MIICVDENEFEEYKKCLPNFEIIVHPSLPNLAAIRQFIYNKYENVFMVDDDIVSIQRLYTTKESKLTPDEVYSLIQRTATIATDVGASLFGFNNDPSPTHYNQHKPFMMNGYINGCAFGLLKNKKLHFNTKTVACESHWINLLNAYHNRYCFIDKRFHFQQKANSTFTLLGGQTGKRTMSSERADTLLLKKTFGNSIQVKKQQNKTKQLHEYQRVLNLKI
jgi:hypothetical protein